MKKISLFVFTGILLAATGLFADMLLKQDGQVVNGAVTSYDGKSFTITGKEGPEVTVNVISVKKIIFDRPEPVTIETKLGPVTGNLKKVENGQLSYSDKGKIKQVALSFVSPFDFRSSSKKAEVISHGKAIELKDHLVAGKVVVFDFYADWCGPCRMLGPKLEDLVGKYDDVILKKIDIVDWNSAVAKKYSLKFVPNVWVYDKKGNQVGQPSSDLADVKKNVDTARTK
jgi:thiol-disulfide isomerase/thioredoxin